MTNVTSFDEIFATMSAASLIEAVPDAMVIANGAGEMVLVNSQTEQIFGYQRGELIGQPIEMLIPERHRARHPQHRSNYVAEPRVRSMGSGLQLYGLRKDGREFPVEIGLSPLQTEEGLLVASAIRDVSEQTRADEQRFRLAAIVASSDDAIIGESLDGVILSWNEGARRIFGFEASEMLGKSVAVLLPPGRELEEAAAVEQLAQGHGAAHLNTVRRCKDGREIAAAITISAVRNSSGHLIGASKVVRDISDQRRAEEDLARARDTAEAATRELEAFSYSVAHDLRAPLRGMNGFAQVLLDTYRDKLDAEGQDWLQEIVDNAGKMGALIDALLSLARVTRSVLHCEMVDLSSAFRCAARELAVREPERKVELVVPEGLTAQLDPVLTRVLIENLVGNAWKFTSKVPGARIELGARQQEAATTFFVRDNGAGFDMAFAEKLFAPFQRLHAQSEFAGTGIGLATVQRIVRRHGGHVWAEGAVDGGATFNFSLPCAASSVAAKP